MFHPGHRRHKTCRLFPFSSHLLFSCCAFADGPFDTLGKQRERQAAIAKEIAAESTAVTSGSLTSAADPSTETS